jgi:hypothetical protein
MCPANAESIFSKCCTGDRQGSVFWGSKTATVDCRVRILGRSLLPVGLRTGLAVAPGGLVPGYVRSVLVHFDRTPGLRVSPGLTALGVRHAWKKYNAIKKTTLLMLSLGFLLADCYSVLNKTMRVSTWGNLILKYAIGNRN